MAEFLFQNECNFDVVSLGNQSRGQSLSYLRGVWDNQDNVHKSYKSSQISWMLFLLLSLGWHLCILGHLLTVGFKEASYFRHGIQVPEWVPRGQVRPLKVLERKPYLMNPRNEKWEESDMTPFFSSLHGQQGKLLFQPFRREPFVLSKHVCPGDCSWLSWTLWRGGHRHNDSMSFIAHLLPLPASSLPWAYVSLVSAL